MLPVARGSSVLQPSLLLNGKRVLSSLFQHRFLSAKGCSEPKYTLSLSGCHHLIKPSTGTVSTANTILTHSLSTNTSISGELKQANDMNTKKKISSSRTKRDAITITPRAAQRILTLIAQPSAADAIGIRLGVRRRGCNGLSYTLNYATESDLLTKGIEQVSAHGVTVLIEPMALFNVVGTTMDWLETDLSSEFVFENPNSKGKCGCGESFNV